MFYIDIGPGPAIERAILCATVLPSLARLLSRARNKPETDLSRAAVEINDVSVRTMPVTAAVAKDTKFHLAVRKEGHVPGSLTPQPIMEGSS
jgi:hypothetical protein